MANANNAFRHPKPWSLKDKETITGFESWKSNVLYNLSLNNEFATFLEGEWGAASVANHGFQDDPPDQLARKTAVQKSILLDRMLGLVAQYVPDLLRNEVVKRATSLSWIWKRLRKYYSISQSEVHFLVE